MTLGSRMNKLRSDNTCAIFLSEDSYNAIIFGTSST
jgi:hypothetical protein